MPAAETRPVCAHLRVPVLRSNRQIELTAFQQVTNNFNDVLVESWNSSSWQEVVLKIDDNKCAFGHDPVQKARKNFDCRMKRLLLRMQTRVKPTARTRSASCGDICRNICKRQCVCVDQVAGPNRHKPKLVRLAISVNMVLVGGEYTLTGDRAHRCVATVN